MKKIFLSVFLVSFILATSATLVAQAAQVQWNQTEAPAVSSTFVYTLKVDALAPVTLTATCVAFNSSSACSAPITNPATGNHTYTLTATNAFGSASTTIGPGAPPNTSGFKITIIISIP